MNLGDLLSQLGVWKIDSITALDLIAASTNAFSGAILIMRPDHRRKWTALGILLMAILGGISGTILRDILLLEVPSALTNPWYLVLCFLAGALALAIIRRSEPARLVLILEFMMAFSLPWYAIVGVQKATGAGLPLVGVVFVGVLGATFGRYLVDITSDVTPLHFTHGAWFVGSAMMAAVLYLFLDGLLLPSWWATVVTCIIVFIFRYAALRRGWETPPSWGVET